MFTRVEALRYRSLRHIAMPLRPLQVLVGPNASGKTSFLDVIAFLGDMVSQGLEAALESRSPDIHDLLWKGEGSSFELAIEAAIPEAQHQVVAEGNRRKDNTARYEVTIGLHEGLQRPEILHESLVLLERRPEVPPQRALFPFAQTPPSTIRTPERTQRFRKVLGKTGGGSDKFYSEVVQESGKGWNPTIRLGGQRSALGNIPDEPEKFPVATWLREMIIKGVQRIALNGEFIRRPSPPSGPRGFRSDGSNLPWVVEGLRLQDPDRFKAWVEHLQTTLPDLESLRTVLREEDRHRYLKVKYRTGVEAPSWVVSDGTLRLMALTLLAYIPEFRGIILIEEPENGIHPRAVEAMIQSLSSIYGGQVLLATHSPVVLSNVRPEDVLCFAKAEDGASDIVSGDRHPQLAEWRREEPLDVLFASGVLG